MAQLSQAYRARRVSVGLTQEEAAAAAGVSRRTLSDFENGGVRISIGNLNRLLGAVGLELATRQNSGRPTLDELADRYRDAETPKARQRARRKKML